MQLKINCVTVIACLLHEKMLVEVEVGVNFISGLLNNIKNLGLGRPSLVQCQKQTNESLR